MKLSKRNGFNNYTDTIISDEKERQKIIKLLNHNRSVFRYKIPTTYRIIIAYSGGVEDTLTLSRDIIKTSGGSYKLKVNLEDSISIYFKE